MADQQSRKSAGSYSTFTAFFFLINYILSASYLGVPYVMYHSGIMYCTLTLIVISFFSCLGALFVVESMSRTQALQDHTNDESTRKLLNDQKLDVSSTQTNKSSDKKLGYLGKRKYEITEMCGYFMGKKIEIFCLIILFIYLSLTSWSYATITASTWSSKIPFGNTTFLRQCTPKDFANSIIPIEQGCLNSYRLCVGLFGVIVLVLTCMELTEQKVVQIIVGFIRFFVILFMCIHSIYTFIHHSDINDTNTANLSDFNATIKSVHMLDFNAYGWFQAIPVLVVIEILHMGLPAMLQPMSNKEKLHSLLIYVFIFICLLYIFIGVTVAIRFNKNVAEIASLNWIQYTTVDNPMFLRIISYLIVLFPSVDVIFAFPLGAITLANNIYTSVTGYDTTELDRISHGKLKQFALRIFVVLVPVISALFVESLVTILRWSGLLGFFVSYFIPIALQFFSRRYDTKSSQSNNSDDDDDDQKSTSTDNNLKGCNFMNTPYSTWFSGNKTLFVSLLYSLIAFSLSVAGIIIQPHSIYRWNSNATGTTYQDTE